MTGVWGEEHGGLPSGSIIIWTQGIIKYGTCNKSETLCRIPLISLNPVQSKSHFLSQESVPFMTDCSLLSGPLLYLICKSCLLISMATCSLTSTIDNTQDNVIHHEVKELMCLCVRNRKPQGGSGD